MEYFILNKKLKIPSLGFYFKKNLKNELNYYQKYSILTTNNLIIYLDFNNKYNNFNTQHKENFFIAPLVRNIKHFKKLNYNYQFIIIDFIDLDLLEYCNQNYIFPILFLNYQTFISNSKNIFLKNYNTLNQELLIKILIEKRVIIISKLYFKNFKFELFLGEMFDNLINKIKL